MSKTGTWIAPGRTAGKYLEKSFGRAWSFVAGVLPLGHDSSLDPATRTTVALVKTVLLADDGRVDDDELDAFRAICARQYPARQVGELVSYLETCAPVTPEEAAEVLKELPADTQCSILRMLIELGLANADYVPAQQILVAHLARLLSITAEELKAIEEAATRDHVERRRLIKSSAGIVVALIVIVVFIATATVLKSVVFGLILAYVFWPVERFYERCLAHRRNPVSWLFALVDRLLSPLPRLARRIARREPAPVLSGEEQRNKERSARIGRASSLTVFTAVVLGIVFIVIVSELSAKYVVRLGNSVQSLVHKQEEPPPPTALQVAAAETVSATPAPELMAVAPPQPEPVEGIVQAPLEALQLVMHRLNSDLEQLKLRFQRLPLVQWMIGEISNFLSREDAPREVMNFIARKTIGIFSFTAEFFSWVAGVLLDVLLTIFFFSLFLSKIASAAAARSDASQDRKYSGYLVRTVFNGKWLPGAREDTLNDAENIISEVIRKLRIWLRGYMILMAIDFTVYSTVFTLLRVPYSLVLGFIAGLGILLPFIGPIAAATLTVLVTLAVGGPTVSGLQILGIIGIFLWHNGIVEQFFLYPLVIGDALGLSTMETIIVVLLGGVFAGITGMIFALPAAAVIKYLVPQIYNRWK